MACSTSRRGAITLTGVFSTCEATEILDQHARPCESTLLCKGAGLSAGSPSQSAMDQMDLTQQVTLKGALLLLEEQWRRI
jgi:hypothetical protein